jgi:hypothetical protein
MIVLRDGDKADVAADTSAPDHQMLPVGGPRLRYQVLAVAVRYRGVLSRADQRFVQRTLILISVHVRDATRVRRPGRFLLRAWGSGETGKGPAGEILQPQIDIASVTHHDDQMLLIWR